MINFKDFKKLDIRIGTVVKAVVPEWSHWVMKLTVDFGEEKKTIFAGIMKHYKPKEIKGKQMPFVFNLEPKKIGPEGDYSEGMMLAAEGDDERPILFSLSETVPDGTKVL